jgi:hypothetical protein
MARVEDEDYETVNYELNESLQSLENVYADFVVDQHNLLLLEKEDYIYPLVDLLDIDINKIKNGTVHVCAYQVNVEAPLPFLQYFLLKNQKSDDPQDSDILKFPSVQYNNDCDLLTLGESVLNVIFSCFNKIEEVHIFKGFWEHNGEYYLFFDCSMYKIGLQHLNRVNDIWLTTVDEIVNHRSVCHFPVKETVSEFFIENLEAVYLLNNKGETIEMPIVAYNACKRERLDFLSVFGVSANENGLFNFTDYNTAIKQDGLGGINRFVLFLGKTKICDEVMEKDECYDSLFSLNAGESPTWYLTKYEQQLTLSSHVKDKSNQYYIL